MARQGTAAVRPLVKAPLAELARRELPFEQRITEAERAVTFGCLNGVPRAVPDATLQQRPEVPLSDSSLNPLRDDSNVKIFTCQLVVHSVRVVDDVEWLVGPVLHVGVPAGGPWGEDREGGRAASGRVRAPTMAAGTSCAGTGRRAPPGWPRAPGGRPCRGSVG